MKFINQQAEILKGYNKESYPTQQISTKDLLREVFKDIERAGRICYKSEDKITSTSAETFVQRIIKSNHMAMLEHGTIYLTVPIETSNVVSFYESNKYSKVVVDKNSTEFIYITTNYRVIIENNREDDLQYITNPTTYHEKRISAKFITNRQVSHELVRHRAFSFAQESTRYCNYTKDKFGSELTFIDYSPAIKKLNNNANNVPNFLTNLQTLLTKYMLKVLFRKIEKVYFCLIKTGWTAQQTSLVLPFDIKTEIVMTGFESDWKHFMDLRYYEKTGAVHPMMKELTNKFSKIII